MVRHYLHSGLCLRYCPHDPMTPSRIGWKDGPRMVFFPCLSRCIFLIVYIHRVVDTHSNLQILHPTFEDFVLAQNHRHLVYGGLDSSTTWTQPLEWILKDLPDFLFWPPTGGVVVSYSTFVLTCKMEVLEFCWKQIPKIFLMNHWYLVGKTPVFTCLNITTVKIRDS